MKHSVYFVLIALIMSSCVSNDKLVEETKEDVTINNNGDPGETDPLIFLNHPSKVSEELRSFVGTRPYNLTGKPVTKDEMCIHWSMQYVGDSPHDGRWIRDEQYDVLRENLAKIESESPSYGEFLTRAVYAGTKDIILTADKKLFGREAGENLSDKFKIIEFEESRVLLSYPEGLALKRYEDDKTMTVAEWAGMGGMLYEIYVRYNEQPSEVYEEVTFDIRIETTETLTLNGSVTVIFKN